MEHGSSELDKKQAKSAVRMMQVAAYIDDGWPIKKALINRIVKPSSNSEKEFKDLEQYLRDHEAIELQQNLIDSISNSEVAAQLQVTEDPLLTIQAFVKMDYENTLTIKFNQKLVKNFLLPAVSSLKGIPSFLKRDQNQLMNLNQACVKLLRDRVDIQVPPSVYAFGHSIGQIRECALCIGNNLSAQKAF